MATHRVSPPKKPRAELERDIIATKRYRDMSKDEACTFLLQYFTGVDLTLILEELDGTAARRTAGR